jgi:hypothetical protein
MSTQQYLDEVVHTIKMKKAKPLHIINGAGRYIGLNNIHSGQYKRVYAPYKELRYNSGNQSTQTQIEEYTRRKKKKQNQTEGMIPNDKDIVGNNVITTRPFHVMLHSDKMYMK